MTIFKKKIGVGTLALPLFLIGLILVCQFVYYSIGEDILSLLSLRTAAADFQFGNEQAVYFSLVFTIPSLVLGYTFGDHFGARAGRTLSMFLIGGILAFSIGYRIGFDYLIKFIT